MLYSDKLLLTTPSPPPLTVIGAAPCARVVWNVSGRTLLKRILGFFFFVPLSCLPLALSLVLERRLYWPHQCGEKEKKHRSSPGLNVPNKVT